MNQEQIKEEKSSILTLVLSSILLHLLLLLAVIFYRLTPEQFPERKKLSADDRVTLWTSPTQNITQPQQAPVPQEPKQLPKKPDEKKEEQQEPEPFLKKAPIITPGKQGIDEQYTQGTNIPLQTTTEKIEETKTEPVKNVAHKKAEDEKSTQKEAPIQTDLLPENKSSKISTQLKEIPRQPIKFDKNMAMFSKAKAADYDHVAQTIKKGSTKSISFKDISLGFNNAATNIGNSQHLMIQGTSPDIPQGDELKYITFINQMANMIVSSMHANPKIRLIPHRSNEKIICFMKVDRSGQLLDVKIITPSKHEMINLFIVDSIQNVGLFNPIPKFIAKNTFEINWHILT